MTPMSKSEQDKLTKMVAAMNDGSLPSTARIKAAEYVFSITRPIQEESK
jgi:hypothetical protein